MEEIFRDLDQMPNVFKVILPHGFAVMLQLLFFLMLCRLQSIEVYILHVTVHVLHLDAPFVCGQNHLEVLVVHLASGDTVAAEASFHDTLGCVPTTIATLFICVYCLLCPLAAHSTHKEIIL
jgi:hypothetical protein